MTSGVSFFKKNEKGCFVTRIFNYMESMKKKTEK